MFSYFRFFLHLKHRKDFPFFKSFKFFERFKPCNSDTLFKISTFLEHTISLKRSAFYFLLLGLLLLAHGAMIQTNVVYAEAESISNSVLRLRILANSNEEADQSAKLKFKTRFCEVLKPYFQNCTDADEAIHWIQENLNFVQEQADEICKELSIASCSVDFSKSNFPTRTYGNLTFPPGNYRTLLITLGSGKGQNWWCVLYPSLCFTSESAADFPEESQKKLQHVLSEKDYETIRHGVTFRFKIAEIIGNLLPCQ